MERHLNGVGRAGLRVGLTAGAPAQAFDDGLLGDGLAVADAHQLAAGALAGDVDLGVDGHQLFPGDGLHQLEEFLKAAAVLFRQDDQHPVGTAQAQVAQKGVRHGAGESRAADLGLHVRHAQALEFGCHDALKAEGSGGKESHMC